MIEHNGLKYGGRWSTALGIALGIDDGDGVVRLGETMQPSIELAMYPEYAALRGHVLGAIYRNSPAVVGEFSYVALINPATSNVITVVEDMSANVTGAANVEVQGNTEANWLATLGSAAPGNVRDLRRNNLSATQTYLVVGSDVSSGIGFDFEIFGVPAVATTVAARHTPFVLLPGWGVALAVQTANIGFNGNFKWREYIALPREIRGR